MMTLRKMTEDEFRAFKKFSVADYASDLRTKRKSDGSFSNTIRAKATANTMCSSKTC